MSSKGLTIVGGPKRPLRAWKPRKSKLIRKKVVKRSRAKFKPTKTKKADTTFSRYIRDRDGKCVYPGCLQTNLQNSHFFARAISAVRYDPDNCDALCYKHHYGDRIRGWEYLKQTDYRDFKIKQLGQERYDKLCERAAMTVKREDAISYFMAWYQPLCQTTS